VGIQAVLTLHGEAFCLNQGCQVIEKLTLISPFYFNLLGLIYFQTVFWMSFISLSRPGVESLLRMLLISGLAVEGILSGYQLFVVHTFCSYCLVVFLLIILMNCLAGLRQLALGTGIVIVELMAFSLLIFDSAQTCLHGCTLDDGTYAVRTCSDPVKQMYLVFSEDCPHCHKVIEALRGCTKCEFHFNPVKKINREVLPGLEHNEAYSPRINTMALKLSGIDTIPVLIARNVDGLTFIRGEKNIITYIQGTCFQTTSSIDSQKAPSLGFQAISLKGHLPDFLQGGCLVDEPCQSSP
jgi:hypothetical protein